MSARMSDLSRPVARSQQMVCATVFGRQESSGGNFEFTQALVEDILAIHTDYLSGTLVFALPVLPGGCDPPCPLACRRRPSARLECKVRSGCLGLCTACSALLSSIGAAVHLRCVPCATGHMHHARTLKHHESPYDIHHVQ